MSLALRARALWKSYAAGVAGCSARVWVLQGASIDVHVGECVAILGARGAGTTTLLHCLAGFRRADAGSVEYALDPHFVHDLADHAAGRDYPPRLLLCDDERRGAAGLDTPRRVSEHRQSGGAMVIATHELARVRPFADRVMLLRGGRLILLDRSIGLRRVAEHRSGDGIALQALRAIHLRSATSDTRAPAHLETVRGLSACTPDLMSTDSRNRAARG